VLGYPTTCGGDFNPAWVVFLNLSQNSIFNSTLTRSNGLAVDATIDQLSGVRMDSVSGFKEAALPNYQKAQV
jgi:hypothetical protein